VLKESLDTLEVKLINEAISRFNGNKKRAAEYLGISRSYLYKKLELIS
jgi:DNA-binding NtrC family response regulator